MKVTTQDYYMDGYMVTNLETAVSALKKDFDMIFVLDGYEGSGKSVLAQQLAFFCDSTLTLSRIVFNPDDFKKVVMESKPYQSIIYDEAYGGLSSRGAMGAVNKSIVQMLTVIREKNLFIFIVLPTFFDLDKYVALWRSRALIHVYVEKDFKRGYFKFYNVDRKKALYVLGKKFYDYKYGKPNFIGRFTKHYVVDEAEYRAKKSKSSIEDDNANITGKSEAKNIKQLITKNLKNEGIGLSQVQISKILGITTMTIHRYLKKPADNEESLGN